MEDERHYGVKIYKIDKKFISLNLTQSYRSQYGSANPTAILGPAIIATLFSTLAGIFFAKIMYLVPDKSPSSTYKNKKGGLFP